MVDQSSCLNVRCAAHVMTMLQFRRLRGEHWDASFNKLMTLRAKQLHDEVYKQAPKKKYSRRAHRNSVNFYPCGILEQVYRQLMAEGVPLIKPGSVLARHLEREEERRGNDAKGPSLDPRYRFGQARNEAVSKLLLRTMDAGTRVDEDPKESR